MFLGPLGILIAFFAKKLNSEYVIFYMKQSLTWSIFFGALMSVVWVTFVLTPIAALAGLVWWVIGWVYALQDKQKELPLVGKYAKDLFKGF